MQKIGTNTLLLFMLLIAACKQDVKNTTSATTPAPAANTIAATKPEVILYAVALDNVLMRDKPSQKESAIVTKLTEGSFVTGTGEKSTQKEEATLRGIPYTDAFLKVTGTTPEQFSGWVFAPALTPVYAGTKQNSPDLGKLTQFTQFLKTLNTKKIESGKKAWDYVASNFSDSNGALADAAFILLDHFLTRMEIEGEYYAQAEKVNWTSDDYNDIVHNRFDMNKYPVSKKFAENGFTLETGEGMVFPIPDWPRIHQFFAPRVSAPFKKYLDQEVIERRDLDSEDGGMIIPVAEIADRAAFWERFNTENPAFVLSERTHMSESWMRLVVINGMDNTPAYDWETKALNEEFKTTWAAVQQKYPGTKLAAKCKEISDIYASEGWKYTPKVEAWVTKFQEEVQM